MLTSELVAAGELEVPDEMFKRTWNKSLAHRLMVAHAANARKGTRKQLSRSELSYAVRKLGAQKHRGRARVGTASSPTRRGGARAFPSRPYEVFKRRLNRKEFRAGMAIILSQLVREHRLDAAESLVAGQPKTKAFALLITAYSNTSRILFVDTDFDANFALSARNLACTTMVKLDQLLATDLLRHDRSVFTKRAIEKLGNMWT